MYLLYTVVECENVTLCTCAGSAAGAEVRGTGAGGSQVRDPCSATPRHGRHPPQGQQRPHRASTQANQLSGQHTLRPSLP